METFRTFNISKNLFFTSVLLFIFSLSYSQIPSYEHGTYSLELTNGISTPTGGGKNFADTGFNSGITLNKNVCNNIAIGFSTNYSSLAVKQELGISNENWNSLSFHAGPQYQLNINRLNIQLYGHLGVSFINVPEITSFHPNSEVIVTSFEQANTSALNTRLGINLGINICKGLQFYVASEYTSNIKGEINYRTRDLSNAVILNETIDPEAADAIVFSPKNISFSTLNTNFGIRLDMGGNRSTRATDHNSSRSNKTSHTPATGDGGGDDDDGKGKATDHNSSRSNKTSNNPIKVDDGDNDGDGDGGGKGKATDHNSSRSNKTSNNPIKIDDGDNDGDGGGKGKATDHNSSRSNKTSHTPATGDGGGDDDDGKGKATDHNSSRSNKTSNNPIKIDDGDNDGEGDGKGKATDHNSSRSNKTSHTPATGNVGGDGEGDGDGKGKATDHNSSRSNKTSNNPIKVDDDPIMSTNEEGVVEIGTLKRMLLKARTFEFMKDNGDIITGNLHASLSDKQLTEYKKRYLNSACKIILLVKKTRYASGKEEVNYELLNVVDK